MWEHYSSIRNLDGPHSGSPEVKERALTQEEEQKQKDNLAQTPRVLPWQVDVVSQSLPFLADKPTIRRMLEECKGNVDAAVTKMLDAEEGGSISSAQESSSVEREQDSDDEAYNGPNKKQDRRMSRAVKDRQRIMSKLATQDDNDSLPETIPDSESEASSVPCASQDVAVKRETDTESVKAETKPVSTDARPVPRIRLKGPKPPEPSMNGKTMQNQPGPRVSARQKKDMKKQAQKAARKERAQTGDSKTQAGMALRSKGYAANPPPIETGFRTLYI